MSQELSRVFEDARFGLVRVVMRDGEPWFVAMDVAKALGYVNSRDAVQTHCKYAELLKSSDSLLLTDSPRGITIIPEADVYALIFRSNMPRAEEFRDWVFKEVLPSIRKTGSYGSAPVLPQDYPSALRALAAEYEARQKAELVLTQTQEVLTQTQVALVAAEESAHEAKAALGYAGDWLQVKGLPWVGEFFDVRNNAIWGMLGKAASSLCKMKNIKWDEVYDPTYNTVRRYPRYLLDVLYGFCGLLRKANDDEFKMLCKYSRTPKAILNLRKHLK